MRYEDISPTMRQFLGAFEALRRIGFRSDDIYCMFSGSLELRGGLGCYAVLRTQGLEFSMLSGPVESEQSGRDEYTRVSAAVSSRQVPQADLDRIWQESDACVRKADLLMALVVKGFRLPNLESN